MWFALPFLFASPYTATKAAQFHNYLFGDKTAFENLGVFRFSIEIGRFSEIDNPRKILYTAPEMDEKTTDIRVVLAETSAVFLVSVIYLYALIMPQEYLYTHDGYYHYVISKLIWQNPFWVDIEWLPLTILGKEGPDHHWFWHLIVAPFALFKNDFVGLKSAIIFTGAAMPAVVCLAARLLAVPCASVFGFLAVLGSTPTLARFLMLRAQNLAVLLIILSIFAIIRKKRILLGILSFCFIQSYHGAVILFPILAVCLTVNYWSSREIDLKSAIAIFAGFCLGLVLNPWYPDNISYLLFHTVFKVQNQLNLAVGKEWQAPVLALLLEISIPVLAVFSFFLVAWGIQVKRKKVKPGPDTLALIALSAMFLVMFKLAIRFNEYFVPVAAVCCGLLFRDIVGSFEAKGKRYGMLLLLPVICFCVFGETGARTHYVDNSKRGPDAYGEIARHLDSHAKKHDMVYSNYWGAFPLIIWHTAKVNHVNGLDPNYLAFQNIDLFVEWAKINANLVKPETDLSEYIYERFKADWIMIAIRKNKELEDRELARRLAAGKRARLVLATKNAALFRHVDPEEPENRPPEND